MHRNSRLLPLAALVAIACSSELESPGPQLGTGGASAGASQTGGATLAGGASSSAGGSFSPAAGGNLQKGGSVGFGGAAPAGGAPALGGGNSGGSSGNATAKGGAAGAVGKAGAGSGGSASSGGKSGSAGATTTGGSTSTCAPWPAPTSTQNVSATIAVSGTYDGALKRFVGTGDLGSSGQAEDQPPLFELAANATLKNVILGAPAADGIHCAGACTLENVWWEDVGEDAATFRGSSSSQQSFVRCGGAKNASDKVFQHNGAGTLTIQDFTVETFGKLYRSCGNCSTQYERHVILQDVTAKGGPSLVGINTNYNDTAKFTRITVTGSVKICERFTGNDTGAEPTSTGSGPDTNYCLYTTADITQK